MNKTIEIPKGYTPSKITLTNGFMSIELEPIEPSKEFIPKDGDFCALIGQSGSKYIFISVNGTRKYYACSNPLTINHFLGRDGTLTHATESEKQLLLSEIDKAGLIWNAEKKRIEKKRWRANDDCEYFTINSQLAVIAEIDHGTQLDNNRHLSGDYYQTNKQATEAANLTKKLLFHFHENDEVLTKIKELLCVKY